MKSVLTSVIVAAALLATRAAVGAAEPAGDSDQDILQDRQEMANLRGDIRKDRGTAGEGTDKQAAKLAAEFNVPASEIQALRRQGLGWGEIGHALAISEKAKAPVADVLKLRNSGMGWGRIARNYGFTLGDATGKGQEPAGRGHEERGPRGGHRETARGAHERHGGRR